MRRWRGRDPEPKEQVANACDSFVNLDPVSDAPAEQVKNDWAPLVGGQDIPLIGEDRRYGYREDQDEHC